MRDRVRALAVLVLAAACGGKVSGGAGEGDGGSGSSSSGGSGGSSGSSSGGDNTCLETSGSPQACISCIETQCGPQLASAESACSALIDCECPGGVYSATAAQSCTTQAQNPDCMETLPPLSNCEAQFCETSCETSSSSGGVSSSSGSSSSGGGPPTGCTVDPTADCSGGADGYACPSPIDPEAETPGLSCSTPLLGSGTNYYCCFSGFPGSSTTCEPNDDLTSVCPDSDSYGYHCSGAGDDPTDFDASLNCSTGVPDPGGVYTDYCCTYN